MRGDRKDPEWAWYWAEVDAETKRTAYGVIPPEAIDLHKREKFWDAFATTSDPERDPWRKDFLVMAQWLSAKQQKILATAYPGGERVSSGWKTLSISQAKWAQALISSEARLVQIAIAWKAAPLSKRTLEGALKDRKSVV